ncbi:unnamed protein product [Trichobilharzia regenti]|uniref:GTP-binding protein Di-Ras2 n=1 Tax=Trichobilharzia regenti TaxID=157069 RepID=A0A183VT06_TRIRE|nr:unnamed protein product [Trichobilharzia regenti]VDP99491.1 unnamed protein product [Trichobilharzia regenti]
MNPSVSRHTKPPQIQTKMSQTIQQENDSVNNSPTTPQSTSTSSSSLTTTDEEVRIVFLGSAKVGKTSIIQRFLHNHFESKYTPTVEDIHLKKFIVRDHLVKLVLMDTAGSYDFPAMLRLCINKANAFVIVFAHDNLDSLVQAGQLLTQIKSQRKDYAPLVSNTLNDQYDDCIFNMNVASPPIVVVCNKSDLPNSDSQVSEGAIMEWLLTNGLKPSQFVYASAKSNDSIIAIFESLWLQNTVSKAIKLARWDGVRRASLTNSQQTALPHSSITSSNTNVTSSTSAFTQKETDFSALSGTVINTSSASPGNIHVYSHNSSELPDANVNEQKSATTKSRQTIFRNSFRLSRRSSGKTNKSKPDIVHMDCVIS